MLRIVNVWYFLNILQNGSSTSLTAAILKTTTTTKAITTSQNKLSENKTKTISAHKPVILKLYLVFSYIKTLLCTF